MTAPERSGCGQKSIGGEGDLDQAPAPSPGGVEAAWPGD